MVLRCYLNRKHNVVKFKSKFIIQSFLLAKKTEVINVMFKIEERLCLLVFLRNQMFFSDFSSCDAAFIEIVGLR